MVLQYVAAHGRITRKDVCELCRINEDQASYLLRKLGRRNALELADKGRGAYYRKP
jgi:ATP-dependent DNA helicase RecG